MNRRQQLAQEFIERVGFDNEEEYVKMKDLREAALRVVQDMGADLWDAFPKSLIQIVADVHDGCPNRKITALLRRMCAVGGYVILPRRVQKRQGQRTKTLYEYRLMSAE